MTMTFFAINLKATYGGWVLYRNGDLFARSFETQKQAREYAKDFCDRNGYRFAWTR